LLTIERHSGTHGVTLSTTRKLNQKASLPIVNSALRLGLIDPSELWLPHVYGREFQFNDLIEDEIPVAIEVGNWKGGPPH
jgi:hypothetical protein